MRYKKFPKVKEELSAIGLGCWGIGGGRGWPAAEEKGSIRAIHAALEGGINFIDTAPIYGKGHSEEILGKALEGRRSKVFLASKCGLPWNKKGQVRNDLSRGSLLKEMEESLQRLRTDVIDLYQVHWPDPDSPWEETLETLEGLRKAGKIRYIGVCNLSLVQTRQGNEQVGLASFQGLYNLLERNAAYYHRTPLAYRSEEEILPYVKKEGMFFLPYSPLMQGLLAGAIGPDTSFQAGEARQGNPELQGEALKKNLRCSQKVADLAQDLGVSMAQLSLAWLAQQEGMGPVIFGSYKEKHVRDSLKGGDLILSEETQRQLARLE